MLHFVIKRKITLMPKSFFFNHFQSIPTSIFSKNVSTASNISNLANQGKKLTIEDLLVSCVLKPSPNFVNVVTFFKRFGFSDTQIKTVITKYPSVLLSDVSRIIQPKIDFLKSIGLSQQDVTKIVTSYPYFLQRSLKNTLIPSFDLLKHHYGGQKIAADRIKQWPSLLLGETRQCLPYNIKTLRDFEVPEKRIEKMVIGWSCFVVCASTKPCYFKKVVAAVKNIGFDLSSTSFEHAVHAMAWHSEIGWLKKLKVYKNLGLSEGEINEMFKKQPCSFWISVKKITAATNFYFEKFNWSPSHLVKNPNALLYSLEKRVVPRCSVLQVLALRNKVKNVNILSLLTKTDDEFLERYVNNYKDEIPDVLDAYQGKIKFDKFNFELE